ncbi:hypothetical protein H4S01_005370 [Coemansia sp. RSA 2610]|nr:hypothetical protein H4S01_005370 [Coemansia sp. RSA 2610]
MREAGCFGKRWDIRSQRIPGVLRIQAVAAKDVPQSDTDITRAYVMVRVGFSYDYSLPVPCNAGEARIAHTSYFTADLFTNMLAEVSLVKDGTCRDSVIGRVVVPIKELLDVREYHGWLALADSNGNPAGSVYLACAFRVKDEAGWENLSNAANRALACTGSQYQRQKAGRNKDRAHNRTIAEHAAKAMYQGAHPPPATSSPPSAPRRPARESVESAYKHAVRTQHRQHWILRSQN